MTDAEVAATAIVGGAWAVLIFALVIVLVYPEVIDRLKGRSPWTL